MRKKGWLVLVAILAAIAAIGVVVALVQCGGTGGENGNGGTGDGEKPSGDHTHSYIETVIEPTCTEKGYTLHKCECGDEYKDNETEALGHLFGEWKTITPATEGKDGEETRACTRENCDYTETRKIPALNHTHSYIETVVEPTCTTKGYTLHKCECGDEYKDNETEALGHLFGEWETITPATEVKDGEETRACTRDNCDYTETRKIPKLDHTHEYTETVVEPTCTTKGYTLHKCECGDEYKDNETEALGHLFGEWKTITPATEEKNGEETRACTRDNCDYTETRKIPALNHTHSYTETVIEPTCTEKGYTLHKCACGDEYKDNETPILGHSFTNYVSDGNATCTKDGTKTSKCDRCEERDTITDKGSAKGHNPSDYISDKEPTCTEKGSKHKECTVCGETLETVEVSAKGHDYSTEWTIDKEATCQKTGIKSHHCTRCGAKTDETEIPLADHNYVDGVCTVCGEENTKLAYKLSDDGTYYIVTGIGTEKRTAFAIPATYNGKPVREIGDGAFSNCSSLTSITIPDSVTSIGDAAFYCCSFLTSITIPDSVTSIGEKAFYCCSHLGRIVIPDSVTSIGLDAFVNCHFLKWVYITDIAAWCNIKFAGGLYSNPLEYAHNLYLNNELVTELIIPDSVTSIGKYAFSGCSSLTSITIPDSVANIGYDAFYDCTSLKKVYITDIAAWSNIKFGYGDSNPLKFAHNLYLNNELVTDLVIPDSVTNIGDYAFSDCDSLTSVTIGNGVTSIGDESFSYCRLLTSITIPANVTSIGYRAFYNSSSLTGITIPDSVTSIGDRAFYGCSSLTSIIIPDSVTSIGYEAFSGCKSLSYNIKENVMYLGNENNPYMVVMDATDSFLSSYTIDEGARFLHSGAFEYCSLTSITIPDNVISIGGQAFHNCTLLTSITIPDSVTSIGGSAFENCKSLTSVTIGNGVTSIGDSAFSYCRLLTSITIPDSVTSIGQCAFYNCSSLTSVTIGNGVTSIGEGAFKYCSLTSITIPGGVTSIGGSAFENCKSLTSITIPDSVTSIGDYAFSGCSSLTSIVIPDSVTSIGDYAFSGCSSLSYNIKENVKYLGNEKNPYMVVMGVTDNSLSSYKIDKGTRVLHSNAFSGCRSLTSVTIGNGVTRIGEQAFYGCNSLTIVNYNGTVEEWINIRKEAYWKDATGEFTVHCTDGDLTKEEA